MKDAINQAFGRGCHCRNCEFKEHLHNGGFGGYKCKLGILNQNRIDYHSFCSEGIPRSETENKTANTATGRI